MNPLRRNILIVGVLLVSIAMVVDLYRTISGAGFANPLSLALGAAGALILMVYGLAKFRSF